MQTGGAVMRSGPCQNVSMSYAGHPVKARAKSCADQRRASLQRLRVVRISLGRDRGGCRKGSTLEARTGGDGRAQKDEVGDGGMPNSRVENPAGDGGQAIDRGQGREARGQGTGIPRYKLCRGPDLAAGETPCPCQALPVEDRSLACALIPTRQPGLGRSFFF